MDENQSKSKVLIVIANLGIAGAQKMVEQLALSLDKGRVSFRVMCLSSPADSAIERRLYDNDISIDYMNKPKGFSIRMLFATWKYISEFSPQIIHTHLTSAWIYTCIPAVFKRIPILHTIHSRPNRQETNRILKCFIRFLYHKKKIIPIAISNEIKSETMAYYSLRPEQVEMVYNPVDYSFFSSINHTNHEGIVFVNVARFNPIKNHLTLVDAFIQAKKRAGHIYLYLAGEGELFKQVENLIEAKGASDYIFPLGNIEDISTVLEVSDVFILPSLSEGLPISLLEAEAAELPIIASNVGGIPDVVDNNGILINPTDIESIVEAILRLSNDDELRRVMGKKSREIAKQYRSDVIAEKYMFLYEKYRIKV